MFRGSQTFSSVSFMNEGKPRSSGSAIFEGLSATPSSSMSLAAPTASTVFSHSVFCCATVTVHGGMIIVGAGDGILSAVSLQNNGTSVARPTQWAFYGNSQTAQAHSLPLEGPATTVFLANPATMESAVGICGTATGDVLVFTATLVNGTDVVLAKLWGSTIGALRGPSYNLEPVTSVTIHVDRCQRLQFFGVCFRDMVILLEPNTYAFLDEFRFGGGNKIVKLISPSTSLVRYSLSGGENSNATLPSLMVLLETGILGLLCPPQKNVLEESQYLGDRHTSYMALSTEVTAMVMPSQSARLSDGDLYATSAMISTATGYQLSVVGGGMKWWGFLRGATSQRGNTELTTAAGALDESAVTGAGNTVANNYSRWTIGKEKVGIVRTLSEDNVVMVSGVDLYLANCAMERMGNVSRLRNYVTFSEPINDVAILDLGSSSAAILVATGKKISLVLV